MLKLDSPSNIALHQTTLRALPLYSLTLEQETALKGRIERWNGLIRIFVHPMYEKWRGHEHRYINDPMLRRLVEIERGLLRLLRLAEDKTPPVIVMEEDVFISKLNDWLAEKEIAHQTFVIQTLRSNPAPICPEFSPWKNLTETLTRLGVNKIILGGIKLEVSNWHTDWTYKAPYVGRCVGITLSHLSRDKGGIFETEISALTHPEGARREFYKHLKPTSNS
jgi:hypothetical protein